MQTPVSSDYTGPVVNQKYAQGVVVVNPSSGNPYFPEGLFSGTRAITAQTYTEANVKNGLQFESSTPIVTVQPSTDTNVMFVTGDKPVIVKNRTVSFTGTGITATVFEGGVASSSGTQMQAYGLSRITQIPVASHIYYNSAMSSNGSQISASVVSMGSASNGQNTVGSFGVSGSERILMPNTVYLLKVTNTDSSACKMAVYITWYEGTPDLPVVGG